MTLSGARGVEAEGCYTDLPASDIDIKTRWDTDLDPDPDPDARCKQLARIAKLSPAYAMLEMTRMTMVDDNPNREDNW